MEITLRKDQKERTYTTGFISARMVRRTIEISKSIQFENITPEEIDLLMDYIVDLYGRQFTRDDLYDGLASHELIPTFTESIQEVVGNLSASTGGTEKNV